MDLKSKVSSVVFDSICTIRNAWNAMDAEEGHWITVKGAHIKISEGGKIVAGPSQLKQALEHHQKSSGHHAEQAQRKDITEKQQVEHENASRHHEKALSHLETAMTTPKSDPAHSRNVNLAELYSKHAGKAEQNASSETKPKSGAEQLKEAEQKAAERAKNGPKSMKRKAVIRQEMKKYS